MCAVALVCFVSWIFLRRKPSASDQNSGVKTIAVTKAKREDLSRYTTLAAEFVPYQAVSMHAKVTGYVESISVDIGDHVKAGQVMEVPELKDDLNKASAALMTSREEVRLAEANYSDVHLDYQRLMGVVKANPKLVAQQDVDTARSKDEAMASALAAAKKRVDECQANVGKMRTLLDYSAITAPFDGVIIWDWRRN